MTLSIKERIEIGKSGVSLLRDLTILLALILTVVIISFAPEWLNKHFNRAGFDSVDVGFAKWSRKASKDALKVGAQIEKAKNANAELNKQLGELASQNPSLKTQIADVKAQAATAATALETVDGSIKNTIADQQEIQQKIEPLAPNLQGWIYLGSVTSNNKGWQGDHAVNSNWPIPVGTTVTIIDDVYVREGGMAGSRAKSYQIGVVKTDQKVRIDQTEEGIELSTGELPIWAKVTLIP